MTPARTSEHRGGRGRSIAWALLGSLICLAGLGLVLAVMQDPGNHLLYDFRGGLYNAGVAILHGHSPYQPAFLAHQAAIMRAGGLARGETAASAFSIPVYPAVANLAVVPISLLPLWLAGTLYTVASIAAMLAGVWLLGVRDWRCLMAVVLSWPFLYGLYLGAIGPFLVLGAGIAWRWRDRLWPPAIAIAAIVVAKVFPWPLAIWLLITRRWKAFALTVAIGVVLTFGAWAVIGFDGITQYPQMLTDLSFLQEGRAVSVVAVLLVIGFSPTIASALAIVLTVGLLGAAGRIARGDDGERKAFGLVVIAALTGTPIVWEHYLVLLFIPLALASPRLSGAWLLPLCTPLFVVLSGALIPVSHRGGASPPETLRTAVPWLVVEALVAARLLAGPRLSVRGKRPARARAAPAAGVVDLA